MEEPDTYVIRVYRHTASGLEGLVECVANGEKRSFHDGEQLWRSLLVFSSSWRKEDPFPPDKEN